MLISISGSQSCGKAQPVDAKVLTPLGWKHIGDLKVGDTVITPSNQIAHVDGVFPQGQRDCVAIRMFDGGHTECCTEHLWKVYSSTSTRRKDSEGQWKVKYIKGYSIVDTIKLITLVDKAKQTRKAGQKKNKKYGSNVALPVVDQLDMNINEAKLPIHPYVLGVLLGDGCLTRPHQINFTSVDDFIVNRVRDIIVMDGKTVTSCGINHRIVQHVDCHTTHNYSKDIIQLGLHGKHSHEKFIPSAYMQTNKEARLELLRGLMDTDGTISKSGSSISFTTTSHQLAKDVQHLAWSLGCSASISIRKHPFYYNSSREKVFGQVAYDVQMQSDSPKMFFCLPRKQDRARKSYYDGHKNGQVEFTRKIRSIDPIGKKECVCISIDHPDHLYITDDFIVTHNTSTLKAISDMGFPVVQRKTSRSILTDWDITLDEVNKDPNLAIRFQEEIITRKFNDEIAFSEQYPDTLVFTERTYADLFAYTMASMGAQNEYCDWINKYFDRCLQLQQSYAHVFYLKPIGVTPDGVRSENIHFGQMIDLIMLNYTEQMTLSSKLDVVNQSTIQNRANQIVSKSLQTVGWTVSEIVELLGGKQK